MKKLIAIALIFFAVAAQAVPINNISIDPVTSGYFCMPGSPTVPAGPYIAPTLVQPTANAATTIETTDGTYFYVITMTTGTGLVTSLASCPVRYDTKQ